jgi:hypothetical protein
VIVIRAEYKKAEGIVDFIRFLNNGEDDKSKENFGENDSDSDNFKDVNFITISHYFS